MQPVCVHGVWGVGGEEGGCLSRFIWMSCSPQGVVCTLQEGDDFGKLALVNDAPRAASIVLREDNCHFLRVDKEDFNRILRVSWEDPLGRRTFYFFPFLKKKGFEWIVHPTGLWQRDAWTKGCDTGLLRVLVYSSRHPVFFCIKYFYMCLYCSIWMDNNSSCLSKTSKSNKKFLTRLDYVLFMPFSTLLSSRMAASLSPMSSLWSAS